MTLFSEIYSSYYQIVYTLLKKEAAFSQKELQEIITRYGFSESNLYLLPKFSDGSWNFFLKKDGLYYRRQKHSPLIPLSSLQRSWLKALLLDSRIRLFLSDEELASLEAGLADTKPLFLPEDFYYYDAFSDGDDYRSPVYRQNFQTILNAMEQSRVLNISFQSHNNKRIHHWFLPCRLEYSIKNDCFRLYAMEVRNRSPYKMFLINLSRIHSIEETGQFEKEDPQLDSFITKSYYKEPVTILIRNERNALERSMLQFANYKKNTVRLDDGTYRCEIFYNKADETELLIEILSFGPMIQVLGNASFLKQLKQRLILQKEL